MAEHGNSPYENATFLNWLVQFKSVEETLRDHPSSFVHEIDLLLGGAVTLVHALKTGGRYPYLWLAIFMHGLIVESVSYAIPDINNFWHSQKLIMFLGGRLPLSITFIYPTFLYTATVAASYLKLPLLIEPFAVGLLTVLMDMPYDILGIKYLFWTWHDTDPNIYDRFYWVPWTSFYFHATFAVSILFFNNLFRKYCLGKDRDDPVTASWRKELGIALLCGFLGMPGGVIQFMPLYHPFHDIFGIHTEVIVIFLIVTFALLVWSADRTPSPEGRFGQKGLKRSGDHLIGIFVVIHYSMYILLAILGNPETVIATGVHEPTGPCNLTTLVNTPIGQVLTKRTYFCSSDYHEDFDWHCLADRKAPAEFRSWYTVCGTPYSNRSEYIAVVCFTCAFALYIFYQAIYRSGSRLLNRPITSGPRKYKVK